MPKPKQPHPVDRLCAAIEELTRERASRSHGPQFVMVHSVVRHMGITGEQADAVVAEALAQHRISVIEPETVIRWHRTGFRLYWRWKSRSRGGRPRIAAEIRRLIRDKSLANRLWGAPRIDGELLKLGIEVAQSTVAKYMAKSGRGRSQTWKTFLHNHAAGIGAMDFLIVPTVGFRLLFALVILRHRRRRLRSLSVTANPTAEWIARQITNAFPWDEAPIDRLDKIFGSHWPA